MAMFKNMDSAAHERARKKAEKQRKKELRRQQKNTGKAKIKKKRAWTTAAITILAVLAVFFVIRDNHSVKVTTYSVKHKDVPNEFDGFRILQISDLKGCQFGEGQSRLSKKILKQDYDMILLTGDYLKSPDSEEYYLIVELLEAVRKDVPVYYVLGDGDFTNPDKVSKDKLCFEANSSSVIASVLEETGARPVYPITRIEKDGAAIYLTGIKYYENQFDSVDFDSDKCFSICVTHAPIEYNVTKRLKEVNVLSQKEVDFDLEISGHLMGGTVRLPVFGALYSENGGLFPEETYVYGIHELSSGRISVISSGLGRDKKMLPRLFNTPEVTIIELHSEESEQK